MTKSHSHRRSHRPGAAATATALALLGTQCNVFASAFTPPRPPSTHHRTTTAITSVMLNDDSERSLSKMAQMIEGQERRPPTRNTPSEMSGMSRLLQDQAAAPSPRDLVAMGGHQQPWVDPGNSRFTPAQERVRAQQAKARVEEQARVDAKAGRAAGAGVFVAPVASSTPLEEATDNGGSSNDDASAAASAAAAAAEAAASFEARLKYEHARRTEAEEEARRLKAEHDNYVKMDLESKTKTKNAIMVQTALDARTKELETLKAELNARSEEVRALKSAPPPPVIVPPPPPPSRTAADEQELADAKAQSKKLGMELVASKVALNGLAQALQEEMKKAHVAATTAKAAREGSGAEEELIRTQLTAVTAVRDGLEKQVAVMKKRGQEAEATISDRSNEVYKMKCEVGLLKAKLNESDMAGVELARATSSLLEKEEEVEELLEWKKGAEATIEEQEDKVAFLTGEVARLEKELEEKERSILLASRKSVELQEWKREAEVNIEVRGDEMVALTAELVRRERELEYGRESIQAISISEVSMSAEVQNLRKWKSIAEGTIKECFDEVAVLKSQLANLAAARGASVTPTLGGLIIKPGGSRIQKQGYLPNFGDAASPAFNEVTASPGKEDTSPCLEKLQSKEEDFWADTITEIIPRDNKPPKRVTVNVMNNYDVKSDRRMSA